MKTLIPIVCGLLLSTLTIAQTRVVHGVLKAYNKYPVANIEVKAKKEQSYHPVGLSGQLFYCMQGKGPD